MTSTKIYEVIKAKVDNNLLPQIEQEIAESEMIQNRKNLNILQNDLESLKIQLINLMGNDMNFNTVYFLNKLPKFQLNYKNRDQLINTAFNNRLELKLIQKSLTLSEENLKLQKKMLISKWFFKCKLRKFTC